MGDQIMNNSGGLFHLLPTNYKTAIVAKDYIQSQFFIDDIKEFDTSILSIPYVYLLDDYMLPVSKQKYTVNGVHMLSFRLAHSGRLELVARTIRLICRKKLLTRELDRFKPILSKYPDYFIKELEEKYLFC